MGVCALLKVSCVEIKMAEFKLRGLTLSQWLDYLTSPSFSLSQTHDKVNANISSYSV